MVNTVHAATSPHRPEDSGERTPLLFDLSSPDRDPATAPSPEKKRPGSESAAGSAAARPNYTLEMTYGGASPPPEPPTFLKVLGATNEHRSGKQNPVLCLLPLLFAVSLIALMSLYIIQNQNHGWRPKYVTIYSNHGEVRGESTPTINSTGGLTDVYHFAGLPYAETPPVGRNRFRVAKVRTTPWTGIYDAANSKDVPVCFQTSSVANSVFKTKTYQGRTMQEDCLFLSVWTSNIVTVDQVNLEGADKTPTTLLPVVFLVHGGGFRHGFAEEQTGNNFVAGAKVVYVKPNYRLGPLGFLADPQYGEDYSDDYFGETGISPQGTGGLNGLHDVIVALQWVQQNIARFGGDPNRVTMYGFSSGSIGVCALTVSPLAKGLFQDIVLGSGVCTGALMGIRTRADGVNASRIYLEKFGARSLEDLMEVPAINLSTWKYEVPGSVEEAHPRRSTERRGLFYDFTHAFVDGFVLPTMPLELYTAGKVNVKKAIMGNTITDGTFPLDFLHDRPSTLDEAHDAALKFARALHIANLLDVGEHELVTSIMDVYNLTNTTTSYEFTRRWVQMGGDAEIVCPMLHLAETMRDAGMEVHHYVFSYGPLSTDPSVEMGWVTRMRHWVSKNWCSHGDDAKFMFGLKLEVAGLPQQVIDFMFMLMSLLTSQSYGSPADQTLEGLMNSSHTRQRWPPLDETASVDSASIPSLVLTPGNSHITHGYRASQCQMWLDVLASAWAPTDYLDD